MKSLLFCLPFLFSTLCAQERSSCSTKGERVVDELYRTYAERMCTKYDVTCEGDIASFPDKIASLGGIFGTKRLLSVDEMRLLILSMLSDFKDAVNSDEKIRTYLAEYPFPAGCLTIMIRVHDANKNLKPDDIALAFSYNGDIFYRTSDQTKSAAFAGEGRESLEEACAKADINPINFEPIQSSFIRKGTFFCKILDLDASTLFSKAIEGMSPEEKELVKKHILVIALRPDTPLSKTACHEIINVYADHRTSQQNTPPFFYDTSFVKSTYEKSLNDMLIFYNEKYKFLRMN